MTFIEAVRNCLLKFKNFRGRGSRSEFWWFALAIILMFAALGFLAVPLAALGLLGLLIQPLVTFLLLLPLAAAGYRRLHDIGWPGWPFLVPVALTLLSSRSAFYLMWFLSGDARPSSDFQYVAAQFVAMLFMISGWAALPAWGILAFFLVRPGVSETNAFGPPPKNRCCACGENAFADFGLTAVVSCVSHDLLCGSPRPKKSNRFEIG